MHPRINGAFPWARATPDADHHLSLSKINGTDNAGGTGYRASGSVRVAW